MYASNEDARVFDLDTGRLVVCAHACDCCPDNEPFDRSDAPALTDEVTEGEPNE